MIFLLVFEGTGNFFPVSKGLLPREVIGFVYLLSCPYPWITIWICNLPPNFQLIYHSWSQVIWNRELHFLFNTKSCLFQIRDTSVLVRLRLAWEDLRSYLTAKGRKRFEVYVCTMAERDYALEMWRLLDPEAHLISEKQLLERVLCVKSGKPVSYLRRFRPLTSSC